MKFDVLGNFHYFHVPSGKQAGGSAVYDDRPRYRAITLRAAPRFLDAVEAEKPAFVIGTGDRVEGGLADPAQALYAPASASSAAARCGFLARPAPMRVRRSCGT